MQRLLLPQFFLPRFFDVQAQLLRLPIVSFQLLLLRLPIVSFQLLLLRLPIVSFQLLLLRLLIVSSQQLRLRLPPLIVSFRPPLTFSFQRLLIFSWRRLRPSFSFQLLQRWCTLPTSLPSRCRFRDLLLAVSF
jgi:hypothetical protein